MSDWLKHVKETMKQNPDKTLKEVLQMAKKTYKKTDQASKKLVLRKGGKYRKMRGGGEHETSNVQNTEVSLDDMEQKPADVEAPLDDMETMNGGKKHRKTRKYHKKGGMKHKKTHHKTHHKKGGMKHKKTHHKTRKHHKKGGGCGCGV